MPRKRPTSITIVCLVGSLGALASMPIAFSDMARQIGALVSAIPDFRRDGRNGRHGGSLDDEAVGVIAYAGLFAAVQGVLLGSGLWSMMSVIGPGAVLAIAFSNYGAME